MSIVSTTATPVRDIVKEGELRLLVEALNKVRVSFEPSFTAGSIEVVFECVSCHEIMREERGIVTDRFWECPHCHYLLLEDHALCVLNNARDLIHNFTLTISGKIEVVKKQWDWVMWLRRLLRLKVA